MAWWSDKYRRPLKDPILSSYTTEELAYEYYLHSERTKAQQERVDALNDKIEEAKAQEAEDWADQMEAEEADEKPVKYSNPLDDPKNQKWMQEEMERDKEQFGSEFGDDFDIDF